MRIGIFETEHFEGAYPVIRLFDKPGNDLIIFTDPPTHKRFADLFGSGMNRFDWKVLSKGGSRLAYFIKLLRMIRREKPDLLYINTISSNHILFALSIRLLHPVRIVVTIHDIHCMFRSHASFNLRVMAHHIGKRWLVRWVQEFNVVSDTMVDYIKQETRGQKRIHNVPGAVYDGNRVPAIDSHPLHLVVPGTLDAKRRDYGQVWVLLQEAEAHQLAITITLLGGHHDAYGESIVKHAQSLQLQYASLRFYEEEVVDQDEFDRCLNAAHFIFIPSVINTAICHGIPEVYGLTKSSGNIFDVIKHARPFIVPDGLRIPENLATSALVYRDVKEIIGFMQRAKQESSWYVRLSEQAALNSMAYTIEEVRARNPTLFA